MSELKRIKVRSGYAGTIHENRAAFSDPSKVHGPDGAFVYGDDEFEVAVTPEVLDAIRHNRLVVVDGPGANAKSEEDKVPAELAEMVVSATEGAEEQAAEQDEEAGNEPTTTKVEMFGAEPAKEESEPAKAGEDKSDFKVVAPKARK
jgi:hypothetical protein